MVLVSGDVDYIDEFYNIMITVGSTSESVANPACAGSPYFPTLPTKSVAVEANCDLDGRYLYVF